ncbi:MAG: hypothetical protein RLY43_1363 [Bacteroidota bacterium]
MIDRMLENEYQQCFKLKRLKSNDDFKLLEELVKEDIYKLVNPHSETEEKAIVTINRAFGMKKVLEKVNLMANRADSIEAERLNASKKG